MGRSSMGWIARRRRRPIRRLGPAVEPVEARCLLANLVVSNADDGGPGSLRQAILDADAAGEASTITFAIPGAGVHTIAPGSELPAVTAAVTIDATTQPGYQGRPLIELDGEHAGAGV